MLMRIRQLIANPSLLLHYLYALPAILIGLTIHEWAHAYAAYKRGDPTAKNLGRMSLNPLVHLDIWGFLCLLFVGFGWAKPVPVNPRNFKNFRRDDVIVSLAGITANFITACAVMILYALCLRLSPDMRGSAVFKSIVSNIIVINLSLMLFNLIPVHPLDGSHIFEILLLRRAPRVILFLRNYGMYILLALLFFGVFNEALSFLVNRIYIGLFTLAALLTGLH